MSFVNNDSLRKVLISYNCINEKGSFPYEFLSKNTLNYIGEKPLFKYYAKIISKTEYDNIPCGA